jgi:hypothetical protein
MTKTTMLSAVVILSAAVAAPVFAQDEGTIRPGSRRGLEPQARTTHHHRQAHDRGNFRGAYNWSRGPNIDEIEHRRNIENFGFSGRDPSRPGGEDPSLHPGAPQ